MDPKINKRKKYINISKTSSEEIHSMLDEVESDLEENIDQLINDWNTEFVSDEDLPERPPQSSNNNVLTPEANIHILPEAKSKKRLSKKKKEDKAEATINWSKQAKLNEKIPCNLKAEVLHDFSEMSSPLGVFEKVVQLDKLVTLIVI